MKEQLSPQPTNIGKPEGMTEVVDTDHVLGVDDGISEQALGVDDGISEQALGVDDGISEQALGVDDGISEQAGNPYSDATALSELPTHKKRRRIASMKRELSRLESEWHGRSNVPSRVLKKIQKLRDGLDNGYVREPTDGTVAQPRSGSTDW